jgi:hypothetical protein
MRMETKLKFKKPIPFGTLHEEFRKVVKLNYLKSEKKYFYTQVSNFDLDQKDLIQLFLEKDPFYSNNSFIVRSENKRYFSYIMTARAGLYLCCDAERVFIDGRVINPKLMISAVFVDTFLNSPIASVTTSNANAAATDLLQNFLFSVVAQLRENLKI